MNWTILVIAGLFEVAWAIGLKFTEGFTRLWPSLGTIAAMVISLGRLRYCLCDTASMTQSAVMFTIRRTVAEGVRIWTGLAQPSSTGPTAMPLPALVLSRL